MEVVKPLFERLGSVQFLSSVASCRTQNVNESFHHLVWQFSPKVVFTSTIDTKCPLYLAVALFNDGYTESLANLCDLAGITFYLNMTNQWEKFDLLKLYHKNIQNTEKVKENRKKLKQKIQKPKKLLCGRTEQVINQGHFIHQIKRKNNVRFVYYVCLCIRFL